jgi:hypothetical protein
MAPSHNHEIHPEETRSVVEALIKQVKRHYVFPQTAQEIAVHLRNELNGGRYDHVSTPASIVNNLNQTLYKCANDKHLQICYSETPVPDPVSVDEPSPEERWIGIAKMKSSNFGVERVERLPCNIGYIEIRNFHSIEHTRPSIAAAMALVAHADCLIIDLRRNDGGDPETVAFMSSYLFNKKVHLNNMYWRADDKLEEFWTQEVVPGERYGDVKDVFVLIGKFTFSAAEEFSYNLQNLKRATLVGERTRGGAHPCDMFKVTDHFKAYIPIGRAINPVSGTNWEGSGVVPDMDVPEALALEFAQVFALHKLVENESDESIKQTLVRRIRELEDKIALTCDSTPTLRAGQRER